MMRTPILLRLDASDRALFSRLALSDAASMSSTRLWIAVTHLGGATSMVLAVLLPLLLTAGPVHNAAVLGAWSLLVSHLVVQVVKRNAGRPRPAQAIEGRSLVGVPDRFSFPSGHACAAMAVAFAYGMLMPAYALPLTLLAVIVGMSRVRLGVHYPGDVLAGQAIAIVTVLGFWTLG
jgi:undecaprenyl-diphosphatase